MPKKTKSPVDEGFVDYRSMVESANVCAAVSTILRIGFGEVCSANSRVGREVFNRDAAEHLVSSFNGVFDALKNGFKAFSERAEVLKSSSKLGSSSVD